MEPVTIKKENGNLCAYAGILYLFEFRFIPETKAWIFWVPGLGPKEKEGRAFPWIFFQDLCRAVYFLRYDKPLYTSDSVFILSGKSYVK